MSTDTHQKITARQLERNAYLYVRQSTVRQVLENTVSTDSRNRGILNRPTTSGLPEGVALR